MERKDNFRFDADLKTPDQYRNPAILKVLGLGRRYFVKTPGWLMKLFPKRVWRKNTDRREIFLTFDDGPHPVITPFVLDELKKHNAAATFFCIGKNVAAYPEIYQRILSEGHKTGNHTYRHLNGWKTENETYLSDIAETSKLINSRLFRPPYGRMKAAQVKRLREVMREDPRIIMWDVLSGDFDERISGERCLKNVTRNSVAGSIVVFHDSEKAMEKLKYVLPLALKFFADKGFSFCTL